MKPLRFALLACASLLIISPAVAQEERPYPSTNHQATYNETRLSSLENEIRSMNGRLEQMEYVIHRLETMMQKLQTDVDARIARVETSQTAALAAAQQQIQAQAQAQAAAQPQPPVQPAAQQAAVDVNGTLGALKMQGSKVTGGVNKPHSPALPAVPSDYGLTAEEQYERAFNFLREADYQNAEESFKTFIDKNPKDKLIENAKYWYGETLYVRGRFDAAAVAFADAYQQNPLGGKAPDSLLKLGISLSALNKTNEACVTLTELKLKYPKVAPAIKSRADEERAKLKCPARQ